MCGFLTLALHSWVILGCIHQTGIRCGSHSETSVRKIGSKQKVKLSRALQPLEASGPAAPFEFGYSRVAFSASGCARAAANHPPVEQSEGKGASPLCFMQMKRWWLSAMTQPMPINKHGVRVWMSGCEAGARLRLHSYIFDEGFVSYLYAFMFCAQRLHICVHHQ